MLYNLRGVHGSTDACRRGTKGSPRGLRSYCYKKIPVQWTRLRAPRADVAIAKTQEDSKRAKIYQLTNVVASGARATQLVRAIVSLPTRKAESNNPTRDLDSGVVFAIVNRKDTQTGIQYLVKWCNEAGGFRWDDTWEHGIGLREDGFARACNVVDAWKESNVSHYYTFCKLNGHIHHIGALPEGLCSFYALGVATQLVGNAGWHSMTQAQQLIAECAGGGKPLSSEGATYGELRCYVKFANSRNSQQISMKMLEKAFLEA